MARQGAHPLVKELAKGLKAPGDAAQDVKPSTPAALLRASNLPDVVLFAGFLGDTYTDATGKLWRALYLDLEVSDWLLIEDEGVVAEDVVPDKRVPFDHTRDVLWVKADAAVGRGSAAQTVEAQFLTGEFTRAGDFEAPLTGGTLAAATGVFCEARTPSCCRIRSRPY